MADESRRAMPAVAPRERMGSAPLHASEAADAASSAAVPSVLQAKELRSILSAREIRERAAEGIAGPSGALPHLSTIQKAFGRFEVGSIQAHTDSSAARAAGAIGAEAYASGDSVAFAGSPSLHTAAHEAAHIVQQRAGVQLGGGVGRSGDAYERHADAVADLVVQGRSAEQALSGFVKGGGEQAASAASDMVQRKVTFKNDAGTDVTIEDYAGSGAEAKAVDECKTNIASGKAPAEFDWYKDRVAKNKGVVPGKLKQFKWGIAHGNHDGLLPGVKGAGGYLEYYVRLGVALTDGISPNCRVVKSSSTGDLFVTNTHYGRDGAPAFYHLGK